MVDPDGMAIVDGVSVDARTGLVTGNLVVNSGMIRVRNPGYGDEVWDYRNECSDGDGDNEASFYATWDQAGAKNADGGEKTEDQKEGIYNTAFEQLYSDYEGSFAAVASRSRFYFRYGASRGDTRHMFETDAYKGLDASRPKDVGINVYKETIRDISNRTLSFAYVVRGLYHEVDHVSKVLGNYVGVYTHDG